MIRYYLCGLHQLTDPSSNETGWYIQLIQGLNENGAHGLNYKAIVAPDNSYAIAQLAHNDHSLFKNLPGVYQMPDHGLTTKLNALHEPTKVEMFQEMEERGINSADLSNNDPYKKVIERCVMEISGLTSFDADTWTLSDV